MLRVEPDRITVLGDPGTAEPEIRLACLKPDARLVKTSVPDTEGNTEDRTGLSLVRGSEARRVTSLGDLDGAVSVTGPADALALVRLRTDADTQLLLRDGNVVEVGRPEDPFSVVSMRIWRDLHLEPPRVHPDGADFVVERNLLRYPDRPGGKAVLYRARERITPTGGYEHRVLRVLLRSAVPGLFGIRLPFY